jgi:hypothetical protein
MKMQGKIGIDLARNGRSVSITIEFEDEVAAERVYEDIKTHASEGNLRLSLTGDVASVEERTQQ